MQTATCAPCLQLMWASGQQSLIACSGFTGLRCAIYDVLQQAVLCCVCVLLYGQDWKRDLASVNPKAADALADPQEYPNLFPGLQVCERQ
jgi:hypothetical protein